MCVGMRSYMAKRRYSNNCYKDKLWKVTGQEVNNTGKSVFSVLLMK